MSASRSSPAPVDSAPLGRGVESRPDVGRQIWNWRAKAVPAAPHSNARTRLLIQAVVAFAVSVAMYFLGWRHLSIGAGAMAGILLVSSLVAPDPVHRALQTLPRLVGRVTTVVVLSSLYAFVFWPLGLMVRRSAGARFRRGYAKDATTYWKTRTTESSPERPF